MVGGERGVIGGMPVLRRHDMREAAHQPVDAGDHGVAVGHGERAAGAEIVLHVDGEEGVAVAVDAQHGSLLRSRRA